jgi:selenocysteine lyase/cysteine desulfurase
MHVYYCVLLLLHYIQDAMFISGHKYVGGVSTPGVLVVKRALLCNAVPTVPGGGSVFYVTPKDHRYLRDREVKY